jgi:hypothetical protein
MGLDHGSRPIGDMLLFHKVFFTTGAVTKFTGYPLLPEYSSAVGSFD